jgi:nitrate reductase assembly molybdenum cofactor insertion protein NarJ
MQFVFMATTREESVIDTSQNSKCFVNTYFNLSLLAANQQDSELFDQIKDTPLYLHPRH